MLGRFNLRGLANRPAIRSRPCARLATIKDWQRYKELIIRLYVDNDWTLNEVMRFMEEQYGLLAVSTAWPSPGQMFGPLLALTLRRDRMYKTKLRAWDIHKYNRERHGSLGPDH